MIRNPMEPLETLRNPKETLGMPRDPYLGKQDGRDEKSLLELPGFYPAAKNTLYH